MPANLVRNLICGYLRDLDIANNHPEKGAEWLLSLSPKEVAGLIRGIDGPLMEAYHDRLLAELSAIRKSSGRTVTTAEAKPNDVIAACELMRSEIDKHRAPGETVKFDLKAAVGCSLPADVAGFSFGPPPSAPSPKASASGQTLTEIAVMLKEKKITKAEADRLIAARSPRPSSVTLKRIDGPVNY